MWTGHFVKQIFNTFQLKNIASSDENITGTSNSQMGKIHWKKSMNNSSLSNSFEKIYALVLIVNSFCNNLNCEGNSNNAVAPPML